MTLDPRTPVLVGVAQVLQRTDDWKTAREPLELMVDAVERAAVDAESAKLLSEADALRVIRGLWPYHDPGRAVAERVDASRARTALCPYGGNFVQTVVSRTCLDIQSGALEIAIVVGAECGQTQARARRAGERPSWSEAPGTPDEFIGEDAVMSDPAELARKIRRPIQIYPIFENALRARRGESIEDHAVRISELWASFNAVAVENPHAWIRERLSAETIRTPSATNRMVSFPYPKLMNSNSNVDMGAALILTTVATADRLGVPAAKRIYPHVGTDAHDHYRVSNRDNLHSSPGIRIAGGRALELAGLGVNDVKHFDVYSCFPSAVQVAAEELGLPTDRPWTVTGGLTFGGGPLNNYVMHGIARMAELLRDAPGAFGMCTANGGFLTKHAFGIYAARPPETPFRHADLQAEVDATPRREVVETHTGEVTIESYTVMFGADGPEIGHAACLLDDGRRTWANIPDKDTAAAMTREEFCGRTGKLDGDGNLTI